MNIKVNSCVDCPFCRAYNVPLLDRSESPFMRGAVHKVYECNLQENSPVADDVSHLFSACPLLLGSGVATVSLASVKTITGTKIMNKNVSVLKSINGGAELMFMVDGAIQQATIKYDTSVSDYTKSQGYVYNGKSLVYTELSGKPRNINYFTLLDEKYTSNIYKFSYYTPSAYNK